MNKILRILGKVSLFAIIVFFLMFIHKKSDERYRVKREHIKVDSIKKTIHTKELKGSKLFLEPLMINTKEYIEVKNPTNERLKKLVDELEDKYSKAIDSLDILKELYNQSLKRTYTNTHEDSLVVIKSTANVRGYMLDNLIEYTLKPRPLEYYEKTIYKTIEYERKYNLYIGAFYVDRELYGSLQLKYNNFLFQAGTSLNGSGMVGIYFSPF